jgi:conjugative relaxase-like TrwC/TraI family protein
MLNIGKMAPGSENYYLHAVARGVEDYYIGRGEAPGQWLGRGLELHGLDGTVTAEQLSKVLAGADLATGEPLARRQASIPGFDLTFRAPKSVSLLWALSDADTATAVQQAHDTAVVAAFDYLEREAARTRRGPQGVEQCSVDGLTAAAFRHRTSRAGDPLLHTHVLVANCVRTSDDGIWRTLDGRALYQHARTAGFLYQAHLRHELTHRLGVAWEPVVNGMADIRGIDRSWIDAFSKRRAAIVAELEARGETSARAAQVATLATRQAKPDQPDEPTLRQRWRDEADGLHIPTDAFGRTLHQTNPTVPQLDPLARELLGPGGLTREASTFTRRDVVRAIAERSPDGALVGWVEVCADRLIGEARALDEVVALRDCNGHLAEVLRREDGTAIPASPGDTRLTTAELLHLEQAAADGAVARRRDGLGLPAAKVAPVIARRPTLADEQADLVRRLTREGDGVAVVVGKAGTGKTFALDAAREVWQSAGIAVTGVALAARAATELQDSAGIPSTTLARLLGELSREDRDGTPGPLRRGRHVLVVDEAGMVGTRQLAGLLDHAQRRHVKVVLVGDPHQLPEIDAGGLFRALANRLPAIELTTNRRQENAWEVEALDDLRTGDIDRAIGTYGKHGRIVTADTAEAVREQLVADWWATRHGLETDAAIMVAVRRADVDDLNQRARARMQPTGRLTGPTLAIDGREFQAGDRIVCLRNDRHLGVVNGTRATVDHVTDNLGLAVRLDDDRQVTLPADYLGAGHVTHGYAITGHKAQGITVDHSFVLGSDELYREWGYVALSRGRRTNRLYLHEIADPREAGPHTPEPAVDPLRQAAGRLRRSQAHDALDASTAPRWREAASFLGSDEVQLARDLRPRRDALARTVGHLADQLDREIAERDSWAGPALRGRTRLDRAAVLARIDRLDSELRRQRSRLADLDGQLTHLPTEDAIGRVTRQHFELARRLSALAHERVDLVEQATPDYLLTTIGRPPADGVEREHWRRRAQVIEHHRLRFDIVDPRMAFGDEPTDAVERRNRDDAIAELGRDDREHQRNLTRSRGISLTR